MPDAFAMLGILADGDVDQAVVDHRRGDDVVARAAAAEVHFESLGLESNFHSSFGVAVAVALRIETVDPAVAAGEDHLRHAAQHGIGGDDHWPCRMLRPGELSVQSTLPVFLSMAMKLGASGAGM